MTGFEKRKRKKIVDLVAGSSDKLVGTAYLVSK